MNKHDYTENLKAFLDKLNEINNPSFADRHKWRLPLPDEMTPLNGVLIGHELEKKQDREQLHYIGQQFGLIPLCPNDLVDLDISDLSVSGSPKPYVHSIHGRFYLKKPKLNS